VQATQANVEKQAKRTEENMVSSMAQCGDLEDSLEAASHKYTFLQHLKAYIADLCDMLQVSMSAISYFT
jgi:GC-rich sequence DNA-binding factor